MNKAREKEEKEGKLTVRKPSSELFRMERLFDDFVRRPWASPWFSMDFPRRLRFWEEQEFKTPAVEMYEEKDDLVVKAELPGMKKEDLEINVTENLLTIRGEKKKEEKIEEKGTYYSERSYGSFERCIEIPRDVQTEKAQASFKDGVLEIRLPKTEEAKRKEVQIKVV